MSHAAPTPSSRATTASLPALSLLVLRAPQPEAMVDFYGKLGLSLVREQHGAGPVHHAGRDDRGVVLEIYPLVAGAAPTSGLRLGFRVGCLDRALAVLEAPVLKKAARSPWGRRAVVQDPAGHRVELLQAV